MKAETTEPPVNTVAPTPAQWGLRVHELGAPPELVEAVVRMAEASDKLAALSAAGSLELSAESVKAASADKDMLEAICSALGTVISPQGKPVPTTRSNVLAHLERVKQANQAAADERASLSSAWRSLSKALG